MADTPRRRRPLDDDDEAPRRRPVRRDEEDEEEERRPRRRADSRDCDEDPDEREERRPRSRSDRNDEERPRRARHRDDEEDERRPRRRERRSPSNQEMDGRTKLLLLAGLGVLVFVGLAITGVVLVVRSMNRAPFRGQMASYLAAPTGNAAPGTGVKKVVVVDIKDKDVDSLHFDLPGDLRAGGPDEVSAVVWLSWDKRQVGTYSTGGNAYQWFCSATVIDLATKTTITAQNFSGSAPPATFRGRRGESRTGDKPTDAVLNFIKGLPRR